MYSKAFITKETSQISWPPVWCSTFWKSSFKHLLICKFYIAEDVFFIAFDSVYITHLNTSSYKNTFVLPYFHVSSNAFVFAKYPDILFFHIRSLGSFYCQPWSQPWTSRWLSIVSCWDICRRSDGRGRVPNIYHDDVIKLKHFPRYWPFVRGIHRSPVNSPHKDQWRGALIFSLICALNKRLSKQSWGWRFETPSQ